MVEYTTTNVRLPRETLKRLRVRAADEGKSVAEIVREALTSYLESKEPSLNEEEFRNDPFFQVIGIGKGNVRNGSEAHDDYLYVQPDVPPPAPDPSKKDIDPSTVPNTRYRPNPAKRKSR